jgi:hypothetical protein
MYSFCVWNLQYPDIYNGIFILFLQTYSHRYHTEKLIVPVCTSHVDFGTGNNMTEWMAAYHTGQVH